MFMLEGNIGAGKSTFLQMIKNSSLINISLEPHENWQKQVYGQSLLANFYQHPHRWAYSIETFAMICRVKEHLKDQDISGKRIIERSIYSGHYCFALNDYENGYMSDLEWQLYSQWFTCLIPQQCKPPQGFIYLKIDPEIAYRRIKKRNKISEKNITKAYLKQISICHDNFLIHKIGILEELKQIPVLILDANNDFESDQKQFEALLSQVETFLN